MNVLLDTCVISELRLPNAKREVVTAVDNLGDEHGFLSVITIGEVARGAGQLPEGRRRSELEEWLGEVERNFEGRVLKVDSEIARLWGRLTAEARKSGWQVTAPDGLIAATARFHGMQVMTRNVGDFTPMGVAVMNPWSDQSDDTA